MAATYPDSHAPRFVVEIGSESFQEYSNHVATVAVETLVDGADHCRIVFTSPYDHETQSFPDLDLDDFDPGTEITISMGFGSGSGAQLFDGAVETVEPEFPANTPPLVVVTGYGHTRRLMRGSESRSWHGKPISTIVDDVASDYFEEIAVDADQITPQTVIQDNRSDYRFLNRIASKYGFEFFSTNGTLYFQPRHAIRETGDPQVTLTYGETLESFSTREQAARHGLVEIRYWDREEQSVVTAQEGDEGEAEGEKDVYRINVDSQSEAQELARAKYHRTRIEGEAKTFGIPELVAGEHVRIEGVASYTGKYYVTESSHRIDETGYNTTLGLVGTEEVH